MIPVDRWTGVEVSLLRQARRMSLREFGAHLGVTDRVVSKWEAAGPRARLRQVSQAALDTSLRRCTPEERQRFADSLNGLSDNPQPRRGHVRWCLVVDLPPKDVGLAGRIAAAVEGALNAEV